MEGGLPTNPIVLDDTEEVEDLEETVDSHDELTADDFPIEHVLLENDQEVVKETDFDQDQTIVDQEIKQDRDGVKVEVEEVAEKDMINDQEEIEIQIYEEVQEVLEQGDEEHYDDDGLFIEEVVEDVGSEIYIEGDQVQDLDAAIIEPQQDELDVNELHPNVNDDLHQDVEEEYFDKIQDGLVMEGQSEPELVHEFTHEIEMDGDMIENIPPQENVTENHTLMDVIHDVSAPMKSSDDFDVEKLDVAVPDNGKRELELTGSPGTFHLI
jgi:hypothetical protein